MPYDAIAELPKGVKDNLPKHVQEIYMEAYNHAWEEYQPRRGTRPTGCLGCSEKEL